jgi:hypothetical protein
MSGEEVRDGAVLGPDHAALSYPVMAWHEQ